MNGSMTFVHFIDWKGIRLEGDVFFLYLFFDSFESCKVMSILSCIIRVATLA